jgi:alkylation response protein AidB-like acyl-CoA dehydrogenase
MHFALTDDAVELAAGLRELLSRACPPATIRSAWPNGDAAVADRLWRDLAEFGLFGLLVPEGQGGLGVDEEFLVAAIEEIGYAGAPGPVVETVAFAAPLLAAVNDARLVDVLAGATVATARLGDAAVPHAQIAQVALVGEAADVRIVEIGEHAVARGGIDGSRALADLAPTGDSLAVDPGLVQAATERATLANASLLIGLSRRLIDLTVTYVRDRRQFGAPIGSFQAVQHSLADALKGVEFARPAVHRAAWSLAGAANKQLDPEEAAVHVSMAKALAADAAADVARRTLQAHGAMGYTVEYDLHLFAKRVWAVTHDWGGGGYHRDRVASYLNLPAERTF